jgi:hypothetical protein
VDASASERFAGAKKELDALMRIEEIEGVPVLVLRNQTDKSGAVERKCWASFGVRRDWGGSKTASQVFEIVLSTYGSTHSGELYNFYIYPVLKCFGSSSRTHKVWQVFGQDKLHACIY